MIWEAVCKEDLGFCIKSSHATTIRMVEPAFREIQGNTETKRGSAGLLDFAKRIKNNVEPLNLN